MRSNDCQCHATMLSKYCVGVIRWATEAFRAHRKSLNCGQFCLLRFDRSRYIYRRSSKVVCNKKSAEVVDSFFRHFDLIRSCWWEIFTTFSTRQRDDTAQHYATANSTLFYCDWLEFLLSPKNFYSALFVYSFFYSTCEVSTSVSVWVMYLFMTFVHQ